MTENDPQTVNSKPKRTRTGRKRTTFKAPPKAARPVRALWEQASDEERKVAHEICMQILEYWMGKKSKQVVAEEMGVPPLRVWQLSQQALSGMLAGLLTQPRSRRGRPPAERPADGSDPTALKKRIADLEKSLARTEDLVRVLRMAPWASPQTESPSKARTRHGKTPKAPKGKKAPARRAQADRSRAPEAPAHEERDGGAGSGV